MIRPRETPFTWVVTLACIFSCSRQGGDDGPNGAGPDAADLRDETGTPVGAISGRSGSPSGGDTGAASATGRSGNVAMSGTSGLPGTSGSASGATSGSASGVTVGNCAAPQIRVVEVELGTRVVANEEEVGLSPLTISPLPKGGARVGFMGNDARLHVRTLGADDQLRADVPEVGLDAVDYGDILADESGGVALVSRPADGGGTLGCGEPTNLCGTPPSPAVPCRDMMLVRFDGATETWATKLTESSPTSPPYLTSRTDPARTTYVWWYAHHGRLSSDGTNFAAYYGAAISVSEGGCVNIHQGDQMRVVSPSGTITGGFDWGCSHSGYERLVWDPAAKRYVTVCKNDAPTGGKSGRLAIAPRTTTIRPIDLSYGNLGDVALAPDGGYWVAFSDRQAGQPENESGLAEVSLLHFTTGAADRELPIASTPGVNARAPHLAAFGDAHLLLIWESSTAIGELRPNDANRQLHVVVLQAEDGRVLGPPQEVPVRGNRYQALVSFPDGSVAFVTPGTTPTSVKVARVMPCP